jgi:cystathionine beta-lyase/cystathionine gamma-synthase
MSRKSKQIDQRAAVTPIYQSSTFIFPDTASLIDCQKGKRRGYIYTRTDNPTVEAAEHNISRLDGSESSLLFSSGMAAISTACLTMLRPGDEMVSSFPVYGGTATLFEQFLKKLGMKIRFFPADDVSRLGKVISERTRLIYLESPTNPDLKIIDLEAVVDAAKRAKVFSIIDSTFATPVNQKPLGFGIDAVIHSASKYLGGHSDVIGGAISSRERFISEARDTRDYLGGCPDPHQAFLLDRGLKTLELRMKKHNSNAAAIASYLAGKKMVRKVNYPGLESHPQHELARRQMKGFGGIVSFDLGSAKRASAFVDSLSVILNAASLGSTESLISIPVWTSHFGLKKAELARFGIGPGLVRLSVGLEDEKVLIRDIERALRIAAGN